MALPPPPWLVNSFSATLEPLEQNADKHTIKINQIFETEPQRNTLQTYILHFVKDNKFSVETYFSSPIGTNPNPNTTIPFATFYDNNTAVGTKDDVAHALATFSYNYFLSGDGGIGGNGKYIVEIRDFTRTQSTGTTNPSNLNNNIIEYVITTKDEVPKIVYQQRHVGRFTSDKRIAIHSEVTSLTENLYGATDTSSASTEGIEAYQLGFTEAVYNQMKEYYTVENNFINAIITYGNKSKATAAGYNGRGDCIVVPFNVYKCNFCYSVGIGGYGGYSHPCCYYNSSDNPTTCNCPLSCCNDGQSCCPEGRCFNNGTVCCAEEGTIYCGGTCQTGTICCNGKTCPETYTQCVNNTCYPPDKYPCNGQVYDVPAGALGYCCNNKFVVTYDGFPISCCGDTACTIENPVCCGGNCYAYGSTCCGNTVCTIENPVCCGGECFPPGTYCCNNVVCGTDTVCCNGQCYTDTLDDPGFCCEGTSWCEAPFVCDNGQCV